MHQKYDQTPRTYVKVRADESAGSLSFDRQMIGIGGASHLPVPETVQEQVRSLSHRMVRVFIQEYFFAYPEHGVFDWTRLDAFLESVANMGADVMASICVRPRVLYPTIDPKIFMPNDPEEWKKLIGEMVKRYSVERRIVTHWGVANEINIGESGGTPLEIHSPDDYYDFYVLTSDAILAAWPEAKVGGPSLAGFARDYLARFVDLCRENGTRLDFVSYNIYSGSPADHCAAAREARKIADGYRKDIEIYQTELNTWFPDAYVEEAAYSGRYAASLAAVLLALNETPITGSFQFGMYDQFVNPDDFEQFYSITPFMLRHWNEIPHRFGLFDWDGRVRPQFFVYKLLTAMKGERLPAESGDVDTRVCASMNEDGYQALIVNYSEQHSGDKVAVIDFTGLKRGLYRLEVYRIDDQKRWNADCALIPVESRLTYALPAHTAHVLLPADSVTLVRLSRI